MNQYEKGRHTPDVQTLKLISDELGVPLNYFFYEDEFSADVAKNLNKLSDSDKQIVLALAAQLLEQTESGK
ncbi:helix-turn-helix transcriptional regulator [Vibrio parahaemolyticus]|nr:helix-turn-helix transcriptional regulator [Vibrio parahaemolyticus]